jgi:hypothetical protein
MFMQPKDLSDKLVRVERAINIYRSESEELVEEINIDIPLEQLKRIVPPKENDSLLYLGYILNEEQLRQLNNELDNTTQLPSP